MVFIVLTLAVTSSAFLLAVWIFLAPISSVLGSSGDPRYVMMLAATLAIDAFTSLPFAYLRYKQRPLRFAGIKLLSIFLNIGLNLFFILLCPVLQRNHPEWIAWFYRPDFGVGYIFLSNLIASAVMLVVRGVTQVLGTVLSAGMSAAISGIAGIGHILLGVSLVFLLVQIRCSVMTAKP